MLHFKQIKLPFMSLKVLVITQSSFVEIKIAVPRLELTEL